MKINLKKYQQGGNISKVDNTKYVSGKYIPKIVKKLNPTYNFDNYKNFEGERNINSEDSTDYRNYFNRGINIPEDELLLNKKVLENTILLNDNAPDKLNYYKKLKAYNDILNQSKKLKPNESRLFYNKQTGGNNDNELLELFNQFANSVNDDDFQSGEDVYNEYNKLNPDEQQQFIQSIQQYAPQDESSEQMQVGGKNGTNAVRKYQQMLNDKYGANLKVDGIWGKHTQSVYENSNLNKLNPKPVTTNTNNMNFIGDHISKYDNELENYFSKKNVDQISIQQIRNTPNLLKGKTFNPDRPQDFTGYSNMNDWSAHFGKQQGLMDDYFNNTKFIKRYETKAKERRDLMSSQEESNWINENIAGVGQKEMNDVIKRNNAKQWTSQNEQDFKANKINRLKEPLTKQQVQKAFDNAGFTGVGQDTMDFLLKERAKERKSTDIPSYWKEENHDDFIKRKYGQPIIKQQGGIPTNKNGYYELNPDENPIAKIPSNSLTMAGIKYPITAIGGTTGKNYGDMQPDNDYQFDDEEFMYEIPKAQRGKDLNKIIKERNKESLKNVKLQKQELQNNKYQNTKGILNNDYFLTGDRQPMQKFSPSTIKTENEIIPNRKPIIKSKASGNVKTRVANNSIIPNSNVKKFTANDFNKEFTRSEKEQQYQESLITSKELNPKQDIDASSILTHKDDINPTSNTVSDNGGYKKGKVITMDFDNPAEAQAIAYKKFKNSQSLSPYKQSIDLEDPSLYQENEAMYLANSRENRNSALQNINPNSTVGQSLLSNIHSDSLNQDNNMIGQVAKNNSQNITNWLNQRSNTNNQQQQMNNQYNDKYYNDVAQIEATKNENDINYMDEISQMNAKRLQAKNRFLGTAIETGLGDALDIGDNSVTFDINKVDAKINGGNYVNKKNLSDKLNLKTINGELHHVYEDANGEIQTKKVKVNNSQLGGKGRYNTKFKM